MKVDGLGVVLAIILMPIILIVTYYIQMQVDTIATENQYNTKLLDATYDAMSAFEINTANEDLSSVADSMRSIVLASNNVFINTLATNLGMSNASKENLQPYIPAVLYTMYDGYYIYSPTETAKVAEKKETESNEDGDELITTKGYLAVGDEGTENLDGVYGDIVYEKDDGSYTINKNEAKKETDYVLKSYVQYSARYKNSNKDVTINYTLDNYLNIVGNVNGVYYTKTGYLIKEGLVSSATIGEQPFDLKTNNEDDVKNKILGLKTNAQETTISAADNASVIVNGVEIESKFIDIKNKIYQATGANNGGVTISTISEAETYLDKFYETYEAETDSAKKSALLNDIQILEYDIQKCKAVAYYASSACFSNWVYTKLNDLTYGNIIDTAMTGYYIDEEGNLKNYETTSGIGKSDLFYDFHDTAVSGITIFKDDSHSDPEDTESNFNTHKMEVIKNSIKYNLNLSISAYNKMDKQLYDYEASLPILLDEEWDKILSNISIVSFMQGWDCGLDIYNNYQIVSSTNNELTVTPSEIYYVKKDEFNNTSGSYHRIDCPYLEENNDGYISFKSKEVKYDKVYDTNGKEKYDHKNLACYTCINANNYENAFADPQNTSYYGIIDGLSAEKKLAGYIGIAKERQDIYKTNALPVSEGYQVIYDSNSNITNTATLNFNSSKDLKDIKTLQITFSDTKSENTAGSREPVLNLIIKVNGQDYPVSINLDQKKEQTVTINLDIHNSSIVTSLNILKSLPNYNVSYKVKSIKAIYK